MFLLTKDQYQIRKTKKKGRGVFARKPIEAGTVIGDYLGRLLTEKEAEAMEKKYGAHYSMDYDDNGLSIFPLDIKAVGVHLLNHSCAPNCDTYFYYGHTLFFALRRIWPGEELTIDYSFDPEDECSGSSCFCDSPYCRGTMYASDNYLRQYGRFCTEETKGQKFKHQPAGSILAPLSKYPSRIKDNPLFPLYADQKQKPLACADNKLPAMSILRRRLRQTGRVLKFGRLGLTVQGIAGGRIIAGK